MFQGRIKLWQRFGLQLSQTGPTMNRVVVVVATDTMLTTKTCFIG